MNQTYFEVDDHTAEFIARLREPFGVTSKAAVIRKALALAIVASRHADAEHAVILTVDGRSVRINLAE